LESPLSAQDLLDVPPYPTVAPEDGVERGAQRGVVPKDAGVEPMGRLLRHAGTTTPEKRD
jgi:hypothetical protein